MTRLQIQWALSFLVAVGWLMPSGACANLTWASRTAEVTGDASKPVLEAHFAFTNTGQDTVEVRQVQSDCGCTTAALEKWKYAPGEKGEIIAKYTVGTHVGLQKKSILVITNDGTGPVTLTLLARIPEILRIVPTNANWMHAEPAQPKKIGLELLQSSPLDEIHVESTNPQVSVEVATLVKGRRYELLVTPASTAHYLYAKLNIRCRFGDEEKSYVAYATVRPDTGEATPRKRTR